VNNGHIVETSLGYFILPLLNVALGVLVLKERMRRLQWLAVLCAAAGVAIEATRAAACPGSRWCWPAPSASTAC
jgi:chloramphenicol-sensitive protein RarD